VRPPRWPHRRWPPAPAPGGCRSRSGCRCGPGRRAPPAAGPAAPAPARRPSTSKTLASTRSPGSRAWSGSSPTPRPVSCVQRAAPYRPPCARSSRARCAGAGLSNPGGPGSQHGFIHRRQGSGWVTHSLPDPRQRGQRPFPYAERASPMPTARPITGSRPVHVQTRLTGSRRRFALPAQDEKSDVIAGVLASDHGSHHRAANALRRPSRHGLAQAGEAVI
jgi:hypothetical protein